MRKILKVISIIVLFLAVCAIAIVVMMRYEKEQSEVQVIESVKDALYNTYDAQFQKETDGYAGDTVFKGNELYSQIYNIPFQKTDNYISNEELLKKVTPDEITKYLKTTTSFFDFLFNKNHKDIVRDQDAFTQEYALFFGDKEKATERAGVLTEWYVDNKVTCVCKSLTDKSLIYKDNYSYFVRAQVNLTVYSDSGCDKFKDLYGIKLENGEETAIVIEAEFMPGSNNQILGLSVIGEIKE